MKMRFILGIILTCIKCSGNECNAAKETIESIQIEWNKIDSRKGYCGELEENSIHSKVIINDLIASKSLEASEILCKRVYSRQSPACPEDSLFLTAYSNGIFVEEGEYYICYWFTGNFPVLLNGIAPGMLQDSVKKILGIPWLERPCKWQYESIPNKVIVFFKDGKLTNIFYYESYPCD